MGMLTGGTGDKLKKSLTCQRKAFAARRNIHLVGERVPGHQRVGAHEALPTDPDVIAAGSVDAEEAGVPDHGLAPDGNARIAPAGVADAAPMTDQLFSS